jgi:hypothetical protein
MSREEVLAEIAKLQSQFPILIESTAPTIDMVALDRDPDSLPDYISEEERERMAAELEE